MPLTNRSLSQPAAANCDGLASQPLRESLGFLLNRAGIAVGSAFSQELKMAGMTLAMWRVLAALYDTGNHSLSGLSDIISVEISTLSRQVTTLTARGLVINQPSGGNWRSVDISLTPRGEEFVLRLRPATERHEGAALDGIDPQTVREFKQLLAQIYDNLCALDKVVPVIADDPAETSDAPGRRSASRRK